MYNDHISQEEAKELIKQHLQEAENYSHQKQLGYGDSRASRWVFLLVVIIAVVAVGLLL
jgi:hypothetical protein